MGWTELTATTPQEQDPATGSGRTLPAIGAPKQSGSQVEKHLVSLPGHVGQKRHVLLVAVLGVVAAASLGTLLVELQRARPVAVAPEPKPAPVATQQEGVAALGRLEPAGAIRKLAAPITGIGGSPRIVELLVEEGEQVREGQLIARFDNGPVLQAERRLLISRIANLSKQVSIQEKEISRYRKLNQYGAIPAADLETREIDLIELKGKLREAQDELVRTDADLVNTELRSPINGTVLRVRARVGERPGEEGIVELGASQRMEAIAEVYESDIDKIRKGQRAVITSENGGFDGSLPARVVRISPQVRQREVLSTDPTGDVDARVVEVRLELAPDAAQRVRNLAGIKTITRFDP